MNSFVSPRVARWLACGLLVFAPISNAADERPNIVFILLDNVGREWFGSHGSEEHCTPNIDRLAGSGVSFTNCYTTVVCGPSRVELLTGRYPHRTGWHFWVIASAITACNSAVSNSSSGACDQSTKN